MTCSVCHEPARLLLVVVGEKPAPVCGRCYAAFVEGAAAIEAYNAGLVKRRERKPRGPVDTLPQCGRLP